VGITIIWYEVEASVLERWRQTPAEAIDALIADDPPVLSVTRHDWKARIKLADMDSSESGDREQAALEGDEVLDADWRLRWYSAAHFERLIALLPDTPTDASHDLRCELVRIAAAGHGLISRCA
jgi:hypothetical protein